MPNLSDNWQQQLRALDKGWDSYGAKRITDAAIATVERIAIVPRSCGGLQIEIHQGKYNIEIEISPAGEVEGVSV